MHIVFVEPCFPANQKQFVRALRQAGATVTGVGERPSEALDDELRRSMIHYEQVRSVVDVPTMPDGNLIAATIRNRPLTANWYCEASSLS